MAAMTYEQFNPLLLQTEMGLQLQTCPLWSEMPVLRPSDWLDTTLRLGLVPFPSTEKARAERIVSPMLLEMMQRNPDRFTLFSGEPLDVDPGRGLTGAADFLISRHPRAYYLTAPFFVLLQARRHNIDASLPICAAQMLGARLLNQQQGGGPLVILGCVTNGEAWQFLRLEERFVLIDTQRYYIENVGRLLGVLQHALDEGAD